MADTPVANTTVQLSGKTLVTAEGDWTITGLHTFSRGAAVPFVIAAGALNVANLDADKVDGQDGSYYLNPANLSASVAVNKGGTGVATLTNHGVVLGQGTAAVAVTGAGTAAQVLTSNGAAADPTFQDMSVPIKGYATTVLAQVLNTASEVTMLAFDVPANDWVDGDYILVETAFLIKNNKGSDGTILVKVNAGAGAQVDATTGGNTISNSATEFKHIVLTRLQRIGSDVWVSNFAGASAATNVHWGSDGASAIYGISTPANFTSTVTVSFKVTLSAADATFYVKPQAARIHRIKAT